MPPLIVKRAPDFASTGSYIVKLPNGQKTIIYRDPETRFWNEDTGSNSRYHGDDFLGFTKAEALAKLRRKYGVEE